MRVSRITDVAQQIYVKMLTKNKNTNELTYFNITPCICLQKS